MTANPDDFREISVVFVCGLPRLPPEPHTYSMTRVHLRYIEQQSCLLLLLLNPLEHLLLMSQTALAKFLSHQPPLLQPRHGKRNDPPEKKQKTVPSEALGREREAGGDGKDRPDSPGTLLRRRNYGEVPRCLRLWMEPMTSEAGVGGGGTEPGPLGAQAWKQEAHVRIEARRGVNTERLIRPAVRNREGKIR